MRVDQLRDGVPALDTGDGRVRVARSGLECLCWLLKLRFFDLAIETRMRAMDQLHGFHRLGGERIDATLARFELLREQGPCER